jgi:hypothetical protein
MKEELTTKMHAEFIGDEIPDLDLKIMAVYGAMARGVKKESALREYGLTDKEYRENIDRVLSG